MKQLFISLLLTGLYLSAQPAACQRTDKPTTPLPAAGSLVITNVNIVDVVSERVLEGRTVVILDGCIVSVGTRAPAGRAVQRVDGRGKYLIPGLWDGHTHALATAAEEQVALPLYVAHGITSIRVLNTGRTRADLQATVRAVEAGQRVGPRIELAGASFEAPVGEEAGQFPTTYAQGQEWAAARLQQGWRALQSSPLLSRDAYLGIAEAAQTWNVPLVGAIPESVTALQAVAAGQRIIEPADKLLLGCSSREEEWVAAQVYYQAKAKPDAALTELGRTRQAALGSTFRPSRATHLAEALAQEKTFVVPLLQTSLLAAAAVPSPDSPLWRYVPAGVRQKWQQARPAVARPAQAQRLTLDSLQKALVAALQRQGVPILAGSDAGWSSSSRFHGSSLLTELEQLVAAGLTPAQALRAATVAPAAATGHRFEQGQVEVDFHGDLVLLDNNPLDDIRNLRHVRAVVLRGRLYDRAALAALAAEAERVAQQSPAVSKAAAH
ncbi:amidohydrolase family protein [Hymenobacter sp. BT635]|uniref:Amidohydrolase family protein n=1 Tax=Hymenobacter nitidus TaxID=2880929 RepID=A0ABS8AFK4_9BACT|nr:amidohydrolase family protein [Hymenobacter nitidus]MCB2379215.1 amidohydrolase family protein [Hymenobacter nitidus]